MKIKKEIKLILELDVEDAELIIKALQSGITEALDDGDDAGEITDLKDQLTDVVDRL